MKGTHTFSGLSLLGVHGQAGLCLLRQPVPPDVNCYGLQRAPLQAEVVGQLLEQVRLDSSTREEPHLGEGRGEHRPYKYHQLHKQEVASLRCYHA